LRPTTVWAAAKVRAGIRGQAPVKVQARAGIWAPEAAKVRAGIRGQAPVKVQVRVGIRVPAVDAAPVRGEEAAKTPAADEATGRADAAADAESIDIGKTRSGTE
jgi:hypothetical protein